MRIDLDGWQSIGDYVYREYPSPFSLSDFDFISFYARSTSEGLPQVLMHIDTVNSGVSTVRPYIFPVNIINKGEWRIYRWNIHEIPSNDDLRKPGNGIKYIAFEIRTTDACSVWIDSIRIGSFYGRNEKIDKQVSNRYARVRMTFSMEM